MDALYRLESDKGGLVMFGLMRKIDKLLLEVAELRAKLKESEEAGQAHYDECVKLRKENEQLALDARIARMYADDDEAVNELLSAHKRKQVELNTHEEHFLKSRNDYLERLVKNMQQDTSVRIQQAGLGAMSQQAGIASQLQGMGAASAAFETNRRNLHIAQMQANRLLGG